VAALVPVSVVVVTILLLSDSMQPPVGVWLVLHLTIFFILSLYCHGELAADRPASAHLTEFYLWLGVGGVLGGAFNALAAPALFTRVLEYPLAVILVCLLRRRPTPTAETNGQRQLDWLAPAALGVFVVILTLVMRDWGVKQSQVKVALMFGLPALLCYSFKDRPRRFANGVAAVFLASWLVDADAHGEPLLAERSFFGVMRVTAERDHDPPRFYQLVHGNTCHGRQHQRPDGRPTPLSYYHPTGPIGQLFTALQPRLTEAKVGVVGLGVGSLAWYADQGQEWTFYEIDPAVRRIAENTDYFRFLSTCRAGKLEVVMGDARLRLRQTPSGYYDLLVLDAFSSDAVPMHLLTREALALYLEKLNPEGILAFHISNRYLDLRSVVAALATDAGVVCRYRDDFTVDPADEGKDPSQWMVMVRDIESLGDLKRSPRWFGIEDLPATRIWTDDFSNILAVVRWHETRGD
jgi:hypothetical protein